MASINFFNSKDVEWGDFAAYVSGARASKVQAFECGVKTEKEYLYAEGSRPIGIQSGNKQYPGTITLLKSHVDAIWAAALAAGGDDVTDVSFDIQGVFRAKGVRQLSQLVCVGCEISEAMFKMAQNSKSMAVELPFLAMGLEVVQA